jgi:MFS transporter, DHA1 family, tetracycline resistance protein
MKKSALVVVFFVVLIDLIGFGIVLPHLAFYATALHATPFLIGLLYSSYSIAQLIFSPIWGSLSDRVGRRPIMIISTLGACASYLIFAFSHTLGILFISRIFAGIMAGNISTAQAYVADVTTPENRARGMGLIGAAFGIGFVLGPAIGAGLMRVHPDNLFFAEHHYALLGFFAAGLSFLSFLLVVTLLPESLDKSNRQEEGRILKQSVFSAGFWRSISSDSKTSVLSLLMLAVFIFAFGQSNLYGAFPLFCKDFLALSASQVGILYVYMGLIAVVIQGGLIRILEKKFGEKRLFFLGSILFVFGLGFIPLAKNFSQMLLFLGVMSVGGSFAGPVLNSLISKQSGPARYGATMGASQGLSALGRAIGPAWGGYLYGIFYKLPFFMTAVIASLTVYVGIQLIRMSSDKN